jgi:hypothetical protein
MKYKKVIIALVLITIIICIYLLGKPSQKKLIKKNFGSLTEKIDHDIVLINIEEGDRAFISKLLKVVDSCKPILIGIDVFFETEKDLVQDSILMQAFKQIDNDILVYKLDSSGKPLLPIVKFSAFASDVGLATAQALEGITSFKTPLVVIDTNIHKSFELKIIERWKSGFKHSIKPEQVIPIKFTRTLDQFIHFNGGELSTKKHRSFLENKIVIVSYLGPSDEDKHFTPIRFSTGQDDNKPDTYGGVIIANAIRTILEYETK